MTAPWEWSANATSCGWWPPDNDPTAVRAVDVASTKLVWCAADDTVDEVAVRMMDHYIRHVLVERDGELIGIVSARDLLGVYSAAADLPSSPA